MHYVCKVALVSCLLPLVEGATLCLELCLEGGCCRELGGVGGGGGGGAGGSCVWREGGVGTLPPYSHTLHTIVYVSHTQPCMHTPHTACAMFV